MALFPCGSTNGGGGGGSTVVPNPTGEAVGELTSIGIDGNKYSIPESSEYEETTLWTGSKDMLTSFTVNVTDPYTDYDALRFEYESGNASHDFATHYEKLISKDTLATSEWFSLSDFYLPNGAGVNTVGKFTDTTNLSVKLMSVNWFTSCTLTKIVGIKYGNGVSSGGGGAYTTTVLFTNGASGDTTFQLSSAYTNFDAIAIYYSHSDGHDQYEDVRTYPTTFLNSVSSTDKVLGFTNDIWYYYFSVYSTTEFRYVKSNAGYITDIIGIKYGSNSGGGGGGSSDYEEDILYNATPSTAAPSTLTLSHDYTDYDVLVFNLWRNTDGYMNKYDRFLLVSDLNTNDRFQLITYTEYATYTVTDETTFTQINSDRMYIEKVVGIKFGGERRTKNVNKRII